MGFNIQSFHKFYCKVKKSICLFLNSLFPEKCIGCEKIEKLNKYGFCKECEEKIIFLSDFSPPFYWIVRYEGPVKNAIHKFKYGRKKYYGRKLARMYVDFIRKYKINDFDVIIPVPLHWKKEFIRGFNQSAILSVYISKELNKPVLLSVLTKIKNTPSQTQLSEKERKENVKNCFSVKKSHLIKGKKILLIDDVYTTGATIKEISKILRKAGVRKITVLTLAATRG